MVYEAVKNRNRYTEQTKTEVVNYAVTTSGVDASKKYGIPLMTVYRWMSKRHNPEGKQDKPAKDVKLTVERTLKEINRVLDEGPGDSKPHEWLGKLTVQVKELASLYQTLQGLPNRVTEERVIHHATVDDRISRYLEAINTKRDYIDTTTTDS